jgi:drug/metabolite transporter (DMT)-like permease
MLFGMIRKTNLPGSGDKERRSQLPGRLGTERARADLALLLVAVIWGSAFVAQRAIAGEIGVLFFNGARFLIGALVVAPLARNHRSRLTASEILGALLAGLLLFGGAAFQQLGLRYTTAGNAGFVTGLYVVIIPLLLAIGLRRWPRPAIWAASLLAAAGLFLLSTSGRLALALGDSLEFAGAVFFAVHVILIGLLVKRIQVFQLVAIQYLVCGLLSLVSGLLLEANTWTGLTPAWWSIVYTGVFSVGLGYTLQALGQRVAPPADAAIILSMEAVFAALFGWLLLGEMLSVIQLLGGGLMLVAMLLAQSRTILN